MPRAAAGWRWGFEELARRHGDFALAGLAARARVEREAVVRRPRLVFFGVGTRPGARAAAPRPRWPAGAPTRDALAAAGARSTPSSTRPATSTARPPCAATWPACCSPAW